jgi:hypothetical protein
MVKLLGGREKAWLPTRSLEEKTAIWFPKPLAISYIENPSIPPEISHFPALTGISSTFSKTA